MAKTPAEKMTKKDWQSLPLTFRNRPGRGEAPTVRLGVHDVPVTFICSHGELLKTRCIKCEEEQSEN